MPRLVLDEPVKKRKLQLVLDEPEFVGPTDIRPFFAGPGLQAPEFAGDASKLPRRIVSPGGLDILGPQDFPTMEVRPPNRSRFRDAIDRAASGLAMVGSGLATGLAGAEDVSSQIPSPFMRPRRQVVKDVEKMKKSAEFLWEVSKDPALAAQNTDNLSKALNLAAETVPYITATSLATIAAGPLGGFTVGSMVEGNSAYRTALDYGVPEDKAKKIGAMVGVAAGAIEAFGGRYAAQLLEKVARKIVNKGVRTGAVFGIGTVIEALEEGSQEIAAITGEETYRDVSWKEATNRTLGSMAAGGFLGGTAKVGTSIVRGVPEAAGPETDIREQIPPISEAVDTSGLPPLETVPTEKPPQVPKEPIVTPEKAKVVAPSKALKPVPAAAQVGKEAPVQPTKPTPQEIAPAKPITPAKKTLKEIQEEERQAKAEGKLTEGERINLQIELREQIKERQKAIDAIKAAKFFPEQLEPAKKGLAATEERIKQIKERLATPTKAAEAEGIVIQEKVDTAFAERNIDKLQHIIDDDLRPTLGTFGHSSEGVKLRKHIKSLMVEIERETPAKAEAKPVEKKEGAWEQQKKAELKKYRDKQFKTANDEKQIERISKQLKENVAKWKPGQGVGWRIQKQVNRGLRIVEVYPETHQAKVQYIKDVGVLADYQQGKTDIVDTIDLIRDKKFDTPTPPAKAKPVEKVKKLISANEALESLGTPNAAEIAVAEAMDRGKDPVAAYRQYFINEGRLYGGDKRSEIAAKRIVGRIEKAQATIGIKAGPITKEEKNALRSKGLTVSQILKMKPEQARELLLEAPTEEVAGIGFQPDPTIEQTTKGKPGFAGVAGRPGGPTQKPWLDDAKVKSPDPGMEAFFQRTKKFGSQKASGLLGKIKAGFRERFHFAPHLPDLPEAAIAKDIIRTMPEAHRAATEKAFEDYSKVLDGDGSTEVLSKTGLDLYAKKIFVEDFIVEAEAGRDVPGGFTFEQLQAEKSRIDDLMERLPSVKRAHEARQALWREVSNDLADRGVISEENAKNPHYVRHFVLEHMEGKQFTGTGRKKLKQPFRAYRLGRKGTIKDISTDILEVDTHALAQIKSDNAVEDAANEIANRYADEKNTGKEGFVEWHYKRPNMYYRAQTFDESKLAQMVEGAASEVDVTIPKAMLREALVLGRKRKGLIIPRWLAEQLDDLPVNKRSGYVVESFTKPFIKWWKRYILRINPFRYNRRNLIGDSERLNAAGRTHAFTRTGEALKILWNKEGEIYDRARDLGVIGTSLWHEMGTAHRQRIFERFKKVKNMSMFKMATAPLRKTIDVVSAVGQAEQDMTQAREDILRLAVFLDALDDVDNFAAGKPTRYGPNIRHWAGWNQDVEAIAKTDRFRAAAKVSRETMVDYGDFTPWENDVLRQGLVPFWSFMKKNAQFWPHAVKEAAKEGGDGRPIAIAGTKAGWNLGKWAVRALGIYGLAYLWNHRDDEADKKDDALQPWLRTRPHLNVGDGTLWEQTALSDFTEWFNVDDIAGDLQRFESGYITFEELMKATALNTAKGPVNKIAQGLSPFLKAPVTVLGHKTFPDVFKPRQFAQAWSSKALKEAALEVLGADVKRFIRTQSGDVTVKEAFAYYLYGSMYRDTSPEELEKQIRRSLEFTTLKERSKTTGRFPGGARKGREREHEILKSRLKAAQGTN